MKPGARPLRAMPPFQPAAECLSAANPRRARRFPIECGCPSSAVFRKACKRGIFRSRWPMVICRSSPDRTVELKCSRHSPGRPSHTPFIRRSGIAPPEEQKKPPETVPGCRIGPGPAAGEEQAQEPRRDRPDSIFSRSGAPCSISPLAKSNFANGR